MREMSQVPLGEMARRNRRMWNDISAKWQVRQDGIHDDGRAFRRGHVALDRKVVALMGPVRGKTLLDMQCGSGEGALSWANLGARVTGVDLSDNRLAEARKKAAVAGRKIAYVRGNVVRLPFRPSSFDRVYTGGGITAWIPDARRWAREIARVLKPGGRFLYWDRHPIAAVMGLSRRGEPTFYRARGGYFDSRPLVWNSMSKTWGSGKRVFAQIERNWPLASLLNALISAGLRPAGFIEFPVGRTFNGGKVSRDWRASFPSGLAMRWDRE